MRNRHLFLSYYLLFVLGSLLATSFASCILDFKDIYTAEQSITNTNVQRTYTICPNKLYEIGYLDFSNNLRRNQEGGPPLPLRPNMKLQCGDDGNRDNLCWITDGHLQIDGTGIRGLDDDYLDNVEIVGFVFMRAIQHSLWITKPGSITFRDCEWVDFTHSRGPIMLDFFDIFSSNELVVTFEDCRFHDNQYFGFGAQTALVVANSDQTRMVFRRTVFDKNNMQWNNTSPESRTHVIESLGPVEIEDSCFVNNQVSSAGVAVYGNALSTSLVHAVNTGGGLCQFASVFENLQQYESLNPTCVGADSSQVSCPHLPSDGAVDNDGGPVKHYIPFVTNALDYDSAFEIGDTQLEGGCNRQAGLPIDGPDAQNTVDSICLNFGGCHVSHTSAGEFLVYRFAHNNNLSSGNVVWVDVTVRVASLRRKEFTLELLYNNQVESSATMFSEGFGYDGYTSISWRNVPLRAEEKTHSIRIRFVNGGTNFCAIGVGYSVNTPPTTSSPTLPFTIPPQSPTSPPTIVPTATPASTSAPTVTESRRTSPPGSTSAPSGTEPSHGIPPITWGALDYDEAFEMTPGESAGGCNFRSDGVDAQETSDLVCIERDFSPCNIGWWDAGEFLLYRFSVPQGGGGMFDVRIRAASNSAGRHLGMILLTSDGDEWASKAFIVPAMGYQSFNDISWASVNLEPNDYFLKVISTTGRINLCSAAVLPSEDDGTAPDQDGEDYKVVVPGLYSAMYYTDASLDSTSDNFGNCPFRKNSPIDAKLNDDSVCKQAITEHDSHCHIAFTQRDEYLVYDIKKTPEKDTIKVSVRVASFREKSLRVELFSQDLATLLASKDIQTPGRGSWLVYDTLTVWDQVEVGNDEVFKMKITFIDGQVNFCSFGIE